MPLLVHQLKLQRSVNPKNHVLTISNNLINFYIILFEGFSNPSCLKIQNKKSWWHYSCMIWISCTAISPRNFDNISLCMEGKHGAKLTPSFCKRGMVPIIWVHVGLIYESAGGEGNGDHSANWRVDGDHSDDRNLRHRIYVQFALCRHSTEDWIHNYVKIPWMLTSVIRFAW